MEKRKYLVVLEVYAEEGQDDPREWNWPYVLDGEAQVLASVFLGTYKVKEE